MSSILDYGTSNGAPESSGEKLPGSGPLQSFAISEPYTNIGNGTQNGGTSSSDSTPLRLGPGHRRSGGSGRCCASENQKLNIIIISMVVFAIAVTVALIIDASTRDFGSNLHATDHTVTDYNECSAIGDKVLYHGGNAVDSAVASAICMALVAPHLTGLGGGGIMMVHEHRKNKTVVIDFRETAPEGVRNGRLVENKSSVRTGRKSIGVPGFLAGLEHAHANYGSGVSKVVCCDWFSLVWMSIGLANHVLASEHLVNATETKIEPGSLEYPDFKVLKSFLDPNSTPISTDVSLRSIQVYQNYIETFKKIAKNGAAAFYEGEIAINTVRDLEGSLTLEDLKSYKVVEHEPVRTSIGDYEVLASPAPTTGPQLIAVLNALEEYLVRFGSKSMAAMNVDYLEILIQILERSEELQLGLGDPIISSVAQRIEFLVNKNNAWRLINNIKPEPVGFESSYVLADPSGSHIAVMDREDNYVTMVTSLNTWFGSRVMTESNGILFNNAMANFWIPSADDEGSEDEGSANRLAHGQRPLMSGMVAMGLNQEQICGQRLVIGGADLASVAQVLSEALFLHRDLTAAIDSPRISIAEGTSGVSVEEAYQGLDEQVLQQLKEKEEVKFLKLPYNSINSVDKNIDTVLPYSDLRSGSLLRMENAFKS